MRTLRLAVALALWTLASAAAAADTAIQDCADCPRVLPLAPGKFVLGQTGNPSLMPLRKVSIGYRFALGETEVTVGQFRFFLQRTGYTGGIVDDGKADARLPATGMDWFAARAYTRWLSRHTGKRYRLPSEAEWEYAARAGTASHYWWGQSRSGACGSEQVHPLFHEQPCSQDTGLRPVASLRANPWGLFDMLGNADEWMLDCPPIGVIGYPGAPTDGSAFREQCTYFNDARVVRRVANYDGDFGRDRVDPLTQSATIGFRVVRELP